MWINVLLDNVIFVYSFLKIIFQNSYTQNINTILTKLI